MHKGGPQCAHTTATQRKTNNKQQTTISKKKNNCLPSFSSPTVKKTHQKRSGCWLFGVLQKSTDAALFRERARIPSIALPLSLSLSLPMSERSKKPGKRGRKRSLQIKQTACVMFMCPRAALAEMSHGSKSDRKERKVKGGERKREFGG